jgi:acyl-CoA thioester hydrolase
VTIRQSAWGAPPGGGYHAGFAMPRFQRTRSVVAEDCDEFGHVNNVTWVRFVVDLAVAHSDSAGFDAARYRELGAWWIVHRQELEYRGPAFPGEILAEETWVAEMRGARCLRRSQITRPADGALLLTAATSWVWADAASGRPRRIPAEIREAFPASDEER